MAVCWSVGLCMRMCENVHFHTYSHDIKVCNVEDAQFSHDWFCMCSWWKVFDESNDFLLCSYEWLHVCLIGMLRSPDGDCADEMRVDMSVI